MRQPLCLLTITVAAACGAVACDGGKVFSPSESKLSVTLKKKNKMEQVESARQAIERVAEEQQRKGEAALSAEEIGQIVAQLESVGEFENPREQALALLDSLSAAVSSGELPLATYNQLVLAVGAELEGLV